MKTFIKFTVLFLVLTLNIQAQQRPHLFKNNDKIRALKTAYITEALDLTSKEAEKFWPIYNSYDKKVMELRFKKMRELGNKIKTKEVFNNLTNKEAENILNDFIGIESDILDAKRNLNKQLLKVISAKKIIKLYKAEDDFNRRLLQRLRSARANKQKRYKN